MRCASQLVVVLCVAAMCAAPLRARAQAAAPAQATSQAATQPATAAQPVTASSRPAAPPLDGAVPIDRTIAVVNGDLVLDSDVDQERRLQAFLPFPEPGAEMTRDRIIERLINRALILQQLKLTPETPISDADVQKEIGNLRSTIPACKQYACTTDAGWQRFLAANGFTEPEFTALWKTRMQVLEFIEERFRAGVLITQQDVETYFTQTMLPEYARRKVAAPKLDDALSQRIREVLLQQQVSRLLGDWLNSLRSQGSVVVLKTGEVAP